MALTFTYLKTLASGDQVRIREAGPAPASIRLAVKIGANPIQEVTLNADEVFEVESLLRMMAQSRAKDPA